MVEGVPLCKYRASGTSCDKKIAILEIVRILSRREERNEKINIEVANKNKLFAEKGEREGRLESVVSSWSR